MPLMNFFSGLIKSRYHKRRLIQLAIIILLFFVFSAGLFWFEYTGKDAALADEYPTFRIIKYLPKILDVYYLPLMFGRSDLPNYELIIDKDYLADLDQIVPKSICCNCLPKEASKYKKAKFIYNGKEYQVKIKVRGDCSNHWSYQKKSWRVRFADDDLFFGLNRFDLIIPDDREFVGEPLNNHRAKKFGLAVPEMKFVNLRINNQNFGPYLFQEATNSNLFKHEKNGSDFLIFGDKLITDTLFLDINAWQRYDDNQSDDKAKDFEKLDLLLKLINNAGDEEFYKKIVKIVDLDDFYKWNVLSMLAGSYHQDFAHNMRIYFDTNIGKFKFIPDDVGLSDFAPIDIIYNPLVTRIIKNPEFLQARNKVLWNYVKDEANLEDDLIFFDQAYNRLRWSLYRDWKSTYSNFYFDRKVQLRRQKFIDLFKEAKSVLDSGIMSIQVNLLSSFEKNSSLRSLAKIELFVDNFSGGNWSYLGILIKTNDLKGNFSLYADFNNNGLLDNNDKKIADFIKEGNYLIAADLNQTMLAKREIPEVISYKSDDLGKNDSPLFKPIEIKPAQYDFFIGVSNESSVLGKDIFGKFEFIVKNAVTDRKFDYNLGYLN